jgi:hypothetical protein
MSHFMTYTSTDPGPERLDVLAALVEFDANRSDIADFWTHADGRPYADAEAALITSASLGEWALADALRGGPDQAPDKDSAALAALLRLTANTSGAVPFSQGLREAFLDGQPVDRVAECADVFRRLALPALALDDKRRANAILAQIGAP